MKLFLKVLCIILLLACVFLSAVTALEYRPAATEALTVDGAADGVLREGDSLRVLSWNIGYGALGNNADFFMDGGKMVDTADEGRVWQNIESITRFAASVEPGVLLLQEADRDSTRSHHIDETAALAEAFPGTARTFANNFKVAFVPYPLPPIGKVDSGLLTFSSYPIESASRVALPCPVSWPVRTVTLKRCLSVNRIPLEDSEKELVLVNLHLEAYDDGEGKLEQLRVLGEFLSNEAAVGNYVIAGGDFNQTGAAVLDFWPAQEGKWQPGVIEEDALPEGLALLMDASVPTCRSLDQPYIGTHRSPGHDFSSDGFQYYAIDGFIVSDNVTVTRLETLDQAFVATDHNPVVLEAVLN